MKRKTGRKEAAPMGRKGKRSRAMELLGLGGLSPFLALGAVVLALGAMIFGKTPETSHLQQLRRKGAFFLTASSSSMRQRLTSLFGTEDTGAAPAVLAASLREGQPVRFVPNGLALANLPQLQEILKAMDVADRNLFKKFPGLEVAVAARLLRGSNITGEPEIAWIRSLPETWPFSWSLTEAQKHVLQGTKAQRPIATNDLVLSQLEDMEVQGRHLSHSDAKWILGFFLHHGLEGQFMPGLLDGLVRHFDLSRCAGLAKNVAATGRLPGWALLAQKVMKAGEQVFLCTEQPNGQLFAMYGVVYPDNPTGVALTQATIQDSMLDSLLQQAQLTCDHSEVRSLFLRRSEELLTPRNLRCSSVLWLGGGEISRRALSFGYLDTWPRPVVASVGELEVKTWRLAELKLYQLLMKECNASKDGLHTVDIDILEGVKHENSRLSKSVLLVRDQELRLFEHCIHWSATRIATLQGMAKASSTVNQKQKQKQKHTEEL